LTSIEALFLPYDGWKDEPLPEALAGLHVSVARLIDGYRLTVRRDVFPGLQFSGALKRYAAMEDLDFTYRVSREGLLINAYDALLFHAKAAEGRLPGMVVSAITRLNMMFLYRTHNRRERASGRAFAYLLRCAVVACLADGSRRRWGLPQTRGVLYALRRFGSMWRVPLTELDEHYGRIQQDLIEGRKPG
jgi:GT2 family glycosyltransferase